MRLLFVTPELTPYSGVTPTGDACAALPKALRGRGHEVTVVSPLYGFIEPTARGLGRRLKKIEAQLGDETLKFTLYDKRTAAGVNLQFLGQEELFSSCEATPLHDDDNANARRFAGFAHAVVDLVAKDEEGYDVVICHDWGAGLVPTLLKEADASVPTVFSFGNVEQNGRFGSDIEKQLGLENGLLEAGLKDATRLTTVSPSYAASIAASDAGPLASTLAERGRELVGIAGGIDVATWNPATDAHLETRYDPMDLGGKHRCKARAQREAGFPVRDDVPLVVVSGRLAKSTGLDVVARIAARILRNDVQLLLVAHGGAQQGLADVLEEHAERWPDRLSVDLEGELPDVHRALSAADLVLVEPKQAASGSAALRAQRYGALPIGPRVGALADTVVDCDAKLTTGSGFLYDADSDEDVLGCVQRAIAAYADQRGFERIRGLALSADHGWDRAAYLYERLFESIAG